MPAAREANAEMAAANDANLRMHDLYTGTIRQDSSTGILAAREHVLCLAQHSYEQVDFVGAASCGRPEI